MRTLVSTLRICLAAVVLFALSSCGSSSTSSTIFELIIRNSEPGALAYPVVFGTAVGAVHGGSSPLFQIGQLAPGNGLEAFVEDANPTTLFENLEQSGDVSLIVFGNQPVEEGSNAGVIRSNESYRIVFNAEGAGSKLSLVLPFLQGNDVFAGTGNEGIALFDAAGNPVQGDITANFQILDAGTEVNQSPGFGADQLPRSSEDNQGTPESNAVNVVNDGFAYPAAAATLSVSLKVIDVID